MEKTFVKGLNLLETLVLSDEPRGVTDLGQDLGLTKSNVHRLLQTLVAKGYVAQEPGSDKYGCTLKLWELGSLVADRVELPKISRPYMEGLASATQETIHLSILDGSEVLYIDKIDSPQPVRAYSRVGGRAPAYCVATGKVLLAYIAKERLAAIFPELIKFTPRTVASLDELEADLKKVREQGYAINRGEWRDSVCGVAAPVFNAPKKVCAAIGISGPIDRLTPGVIRDVAPAVMDAAQKISRALGFTGNYGSF